MKVVLVPIPPDKVEDTYAMWLPYLSEIAKRSKCDLMAMQGMLYRTEVQAFFVWEPDEKVTKAFIGVRYMDRGKDRVGEIIWLTGVDRKSWVHLFADLEKYLREHQRCVAIKAIARPGWKSVLKGFGFRLTHLVMEKEELVSPAAIPPKGYADLSGDGRDPNNRLSPQFRPRE